MKQGQIEEVYQRLNRTLASYENLDMYEICLNNNPDMRDMGIWLGDKTIFPGVDFDDFIEEVRELAIKTIKEKIKETVDKFEKSHKDKIINSLALESPYQVDS